MKNLPEKLWNVAFLVRDFPEELRTVGPQHFNGRFDETFLQPLRELGDQEASIKHFLGHYPADRFIWVGLRVSGPKRLDGMAEARHRIEGMIDGVAACHSTARPEISEFVWIGGADEADLHVYIHHQQSWADSLGTEISRATWRQRDEELRARVLKFYSLAIDMHSRSQTPLAKQIRHSLRMFRHGQHSGSWGVEYICKFCALEGLVCGGLQEKKLATLITRTIALFPEAIQDSEEMIRKLWKYRSAAVHTAQAFDAGCLDEGAELGVHIAEIEHLFIAVLVFALDRIYAADDVAQLWADVANYSPPTFVYLRRPSDLARYAIRQMEVSLSVRLAGGGEIFRKHLASGKAAYDAANL
jgi:hypothetical protein